MSGRAPAGAAARARAYLVSLDPKLPRAVWVMELGSFVNSLGTGIVFPFMIIFLHNERGLGLGIAGLVVSAIGVASMVSSPLIGRVVDRIGGRTTAAVSLVAQALGYGLFPLVHEPWHAFAFAVVAGIGNGGFRPAQSALLTGLTPAHRMHAAWALQRVTFNLGFGLGGLAGGLIASSSGRGLEAIFVVDAATFLVFAAVLLFIPEPEIARPERQERHDGYAQLFRNRALMGIVLINVLLVAAGYAQLEILPVFAKNEAGVSDAAIGIVFLVNTLVIVVMQLPVARALEGRRRMRALALMPLLWALAWLVVEVGGTLEAAAAAAVFCIAGAVFGLGETLHGPTQGALIADLTPAHLRGRSFALSSNSWELGLVVGPPIGAFVLAAAPFALWPLAAGACVAAAAATILCERAIPPGLRLTPG